MSDLIPLEEINAVEVFTDEGIEKLLTRIETDALSVVHDMSTANGRQACKSHAYKITLSKGVVERAGIDLGADLSERLKKLQGYRKSARDRLTDLAEKIREPLTKYEEEEAARKEAERLALEQAAALEEAHTMNDLFDRERELEAREAEIAKERREQADKEAREAVEKAAQDRQARFKAEAEAKAKEDAEAAIQAERDRARKAEIDAHNTKVIAERRAAEAAEWAEKEKADAIEAERKRLLREQAERDIEAKKAAEIAEEEARKQRENKEHMREVNAGALLALKENNVSQDDAVIFITLVYQKKIPGIRMVY